MSKKLSKKILEKLRILEPKLQHASKYGHYQEANRMIKQIQQLFVNDRSHFRVLKSKNWYFQSALEDNRVDYAKTGFESIRARANSNTRIYLEATILLGVCYLRKKDIDSAKEYIKEAILFINNIQSDERRNQFQKRIVERIESESILGYLSSESAKPVDPKQLHEDAVKLIKSKSDIYIFNEIGNSVPKGAMSQIKGIKDYSIKLLPIHDQKLLYPGKTSISNVNFGRKVVDAIKCIGWRTICDPESQIYNLWMKQVPEVFNKGYFASALAATLTKFSIGIPILATGVLAIVMQYTAMEFCERFKPKDIMIKINEKA